MQYRKTIPQYYDLFMGDEKEIIQPLQQLLKRHHIQPQDVLELACGTGTILQSFPKTTKISGLDISLGMLKQARKKIPRAQFHHGDMSDFSIPEKFDLILCMFDSINELLSFQLWKSMFRAVATHLEEDGYFIFDCNSLKRLQYLSNRSFLYGYTFNKDYVLLQTEKTKKHNTIDLVFRVFQHQKGSSYLLQEDHIYETGFPLEKISHALKRFFIIKEVLSVSLEKSNLQSRRYFFVCKKKKRS